MSETLLVEVEQEQVARTEKSSQLVVQTTDLRMAYPMGKLEVQALRGLDLEIRKGEFISIMGPSGCGKSTLLHILGGLLTPTGGRVMVGGEDTTRMSDGERTDLRKRKIGFIFQRFNLFPTLTVEGNLKLAERIAAGAKGKDKSSEREAAARRVQILRAVGLAEKKHHKPVELSGGEQQRVALARAIINRPAILLADEPTGNLDSENSDVVLGMLKELNQRFAQTIVMITHDPWAAGFSDRVIHMKDGRIDV
jgi:putative ABC transport system ATP-binding protein